MKHNYQLSPSILSANLAHLAADVEAVLAAGADRIHFDVMDNHYVPNLTFGPVVCKALRAVGIQAPIDVHLMTQPVDSLVEPFAQAGATLICFHPEATFHIDRTLQLIKDHGLSAGLVFNPATPLTYLEHVYDKVDRVLLMSVNPGFGGQTFIPATFDKISAARRFLDSVNSPARLEVDGGVCIDNIAAIAQAGADTFVAGSAIFGASDMQAAVKSMKDKLAALA